MVPGEYNMSGKSHFSKSHFFFSLSQEAKHHYPTKDTWKKKTNRFSASCTSNKARHMEPDREYTVAFHKIRRGIIDK